MEQTARRIRKILIIDDDMDDYILLKEAMKKVDESVSINYINSCEEIPKYKGQQFDLLLLDINMPKYDGFVWLKGIREKGYHSLPIVMYTNSQSPANMRRAYSEGANLYFPKPETFTELINSLKTLLSLDWSHPPEITSKYSSNGAFTGFTN